MTPRTTCPVCSRPVPANVDGTPKRHWHRVPTGSLPIAGGVLAAVKMEPCPGGAYDLHGILMSDPMVRAIREGRKSVTRRMSDQWGRLQVGDRLWVREVWGPYDQGAFGQDHTSDPPEAIIYRADGSARIWDGAAFVPGAATSGDVPDDRRWRSSLIMPFSVCRTLLEVTEPVRREPVRGITDEEAMREGAHANPDYPEISGYPWTMGFDGDALTTPAGCFRLAWDALHPGTWTTANPWRIVFRVLP